LKVLAAALAAFLTAGGVMADQGKATVKVEPVPVEGPYPHAMSVAISPPWDQQGRWILRSPETIGSNHGLLFIDHSRPDMPPVTIPKHPLEWKRSRQGILFYDCALENGISFSVRIRPGKTDVEIVSTITNGYVADMTDSGNQYCLIQKGVQGFEDPRAERTFIRVKGKWVALARTRPGLKPGEKPFFIVTNTADLPPLPKAQIERSWWADEQADIPLITTVSEDGRRLVALAFDNSYKIMTNADIPCIHADPMFPDCPVGRTVGVRGKLYFVEGKLDNVLPLFLRDFPEWRDRVR
jgi:hypothetical protein